MLWCALALAAPPGPPSTLGDLGGDVAKRTGLWLAVHPADADAVVNGTIVSGEHDNVVALAGVDPETGEAFVFCSGSQIDDRWVLTAAHCVIGSSDVEGYGDDLYVLYGDDIAGVGYTDKVAWKSSAYNPLYDPGPVTDDSGLVEMAEARPGIPWTVLNDAAVDDGWISTELTFYGFGITSDGGQDVGTKRTTIIPIQSIEPTDVITFSATTNVCNGDSGGPSTYEGPDGPEQVGINSYVTPTCAHGSAGSARVDSQLGWITSLVPDAALDYSDLPPPPSEGGSTGGRDWLDFGIRDDVPGLGGHWPAGGAGPDHGCDTAGGSAGLGLALVLGALRRRR